MKVYAMWYGGTNYAVPEAGDVETFSSLKIAKEVFWNRADYDPHYPCVQDSEMQVFFSRPGADAYPDRIIKMGPRGGVVCERC